MKYSLIREVNPSFPVDFNHIGLEDLFYVYKIKSNINNPFHNVKQGDIGGLILSYSLLEFIEYNSWIDENSIVIDCSLDNVLVTNSFLIGCEIRNSKINASKLIKTNSENINLTNVHFIGPNPDETLDYRMFISFTENNDIENPFTINYYELNNAELSKLIIVKVISDVWTNSSQYHLNSGLGLNGLNLFFDPNGFYVTAKTRLHLGINLDRRVATIIHKSSSLSAAISKFKEICREQKSYYNGDYGTKKGINAKVRAGLYINGLVEEVGIHRLEEFDFSWYRAAKETYDYCRPTSPFDITSKF